MDRTKKQIRTPISYYGGKQALLHHTLPLFPNHNTYTEVFFGGGSEFFAKVPSKNETINDINSVVVNFYQVLKNNFKALKGMIDATLYSREMHRNAQYIITNKRFADPVHLAWAFWMCANFSFSYKLGGGMKYKNVNDGGSLPGMMKRRKEEFTELLVRRIENTVIENDDALKVLDARNAENCFHRLDPPYPHADQGHYKGYGDAEFDSLLKWCSVECAGKFLLSNYDHPLLRKYAKKCGWKVKEIPIRIQASKKRKLVPVEVLVWNYEENEGQQNLFQYEH